MTSTRKLRRRMIDEPTQSDATLLLKVEDLIHLAMGPNNQNVINFKLLQTILYILARQMRLLDQKVELKAGKREQLSESVTEEESSEVPTRSSKKTGDKDKPKKTRPDADSERSTPEDQKAGRRGKSDAVESDEDEREHRKRRGKGERDEDEEDEDERREKRRDGRESPEGRERKGRGKDEGRGGKGKGGRGRDDEGYEGKGKGKGGRGRDDESEDRARRGDRGRDEESPDERGGKGGRGRGKDDDGAGGGRGGGRDDEGLGGGGGGRGKGGRSQDRGEESTDGRRRDRKDDEDEGGKGGRGRGAEGRGKGGEGSEGRGKSAGGRGRDDEGPEARGKGGAGGRGKGEGREEGEGKGAGKKGGKGGRDEDDEERGGRKGRSGDRGRDDERDDSKGRGGRGKGGEGGGRDDDDVSRGGARGRGRGEDEGGGAGGRGRGGAGGRGGEDEEGGGRGGRGGRGGEGYDDESDEEGGGRGGRGGRGAGGKGKRGPGDDKSYDGGEYDDGRGGGGRKGGGGGGAGGAGGPGGGRGGRGGAGREAGGRGSTSSIAVSEKSYGDKDKVLVVGKGPKTGPQPPRVGAVEVVTQKEFATLANAVKALQEKAGPLPTPTLPDNKKLRDDIVRGSASLMDTMQAMRLGARVQAAEKAIDTMADLLTTLASQGVLPPEVARAAEELHDEVKAVRREIDAASGKGDAADKKGGKGKGGAGGAGGAGGGGGGGGATGSPSGVSTVSGATGGVARFVRGGGYDPKANVAQSELDEALRRLKEEIMQNMTAMMNKAAGAADAAALHVKSISDKMEVATKLDDRVSCLHTLVNDYAEQLAGFDNGLTTQMAGFQEQMVQMRSDLTGGLSQLEQVNNNAETAAVLELTERYEGLVSELDSTLHAHQGLTTYQRELSDELRTLVEAVEMMREQKADRDEVQDGLRDKADSSRLAGLLTEAQFQHSRESLEVRMEMCYDKFRKQDAVWMEVVRDFARVSETKAELMQLLSIREEAQAELRELNCKVKQLAKMLGDPKAAIITRKLAKDATCAVCRVPALMHPEEPMRPFSLPMARPPPAGAPAEADKAEDEVEPCLREMLIAAEPSDDELPPHFCKRWVGGSHTMLGHAPGLGSVSRSKAKKFPFTYPAKKYLGYGQDGKLYKLEDFEPGGPCAECNEPPTPPAQAPPTDAAGSPGEKIPGEADDAAAAAEAPIMSRRVTLVDANTARRVTVIDDNQLVEALEAEVALASPGGSRRPTVTEEGAPKKASLTEVPRNSFEEESVKPVTGTTSTVTEGTDVTEVAVRDVTRGRASVVIDLGPRRATITGDVDTFPTLSARVSTVARASAIAMAQMSGRDTEVGTTVKGEVTIIPEDVAEREGIMKEIAESKSDKDTAAGEAGSGTPVQE